MSAAQAAAAMAIGALDLEKSPVEQVLRQLVVQPRAGLSSSEARQRLARYGPNALVEKEESLAAKILGHFTGPIAYMIEAAAIVSAILGRWEDFAIISTLLLFNVALEFWQDMKATNALAALKFLQLVAGGHILLFITRSEHWFFEPPHPAPPLFLAIVATQAVAVLMCAFGWLVEPISWKLIGWVWLYNIAWMIALGGVRVATKRFADFRTARHRKSIALMNEPLHPAAAATAA